jgi:hypothetical protein
MDRFDLRAVKQTEYILKVSVTKAGTTEADVQLGIGDGSLTVDFDTREIRRGAEVWAKFGEVELPSQQWKVWL